MTRLLAVLATIGVGRADRACSRPSTPSWPSARASSRRRSSPRRSQRWSSARSRVVLGEAGQVRRVPHIPPLYLTGGLMGAVLVSVSLVTVRTLGAGGVVAATVLGTARGVGDPRPVRLPRPRPGRPHAGARCSASRSCSAAPRSSPPADGPAWHSASVVDGSRRAPALPRPVRRRRAAGLAGRARRARRRGGRRRRLPAQPAPGARAGRGRARVGRRLRALPPVARRTSATSRPPSSAAGGCSTSTPIRPPWPSASAPTR